MQDTYTRAKTKMGRTNIWMGRGLDIAGLVGIGAFNTWLALIWHFIKLLFPSRGTGTNPGRQ